MGWLCVACMKWRGRVIKAPHVSSLLVYLRVRTHGQRLFRNGASCHGRQAGAVQLSDGKWCQAHTCWWPGPPGCVLHCYPGLWGSWLLGRSGLPGSPGLGAQPGICSRARCLWKPGGQGKHRLCSPDSSLLLTTGTELWLQALATCPGVWCGIFSAIQRVQAWLWTDLASPGDGKLLGPAVSQRFWWESCTVGHFRLLGRCSWVGQPTLL